MHGRGNQKRGLNVKKRSVFLIGFFCIVVLGVIFTGCASKQQAVDIFADEAAGLLTIRNETNANIVLFAGNVMRGNVLGGIRANSSRNFDIAKIDGLSAEGAFMIYGVTEMAYRTKGSYVSGDDILFTGFVSFNLNEQQKTELLIPRQIDDSMSFSIMVSNDTPVVCELRIDTPDGIKIAALKPYERNKRIWIKSNNHGGYVIYPVYTWYSRDGLRSMAAAFTDGVNVNPTAAGAGFSIMMLNFDHRAVSNERIQLLFE